VLERNHSIILSNLDLLETFFAEHEDLFAFQRPKAGPIAFPRLRVGSASAFCDRLVQQAGVLLLPSVVYDAGDSHFRIGFGRRDMPAALAAWRGYLDASSRPNA